MVEALRSSVRPFVTYGFTLMVGYGFVSGSIGGGELLGMAGMVIGYWFRSRDDK